ncbi:hypothetical protein [Saccharophagus degradans]|uniref:Translation elongation factor EFTu/EF1A C-terminal domain-containing protein n=1 Tax=Saccharophagus degradans (strain 2-40 / ATCC 43961 / DSM 17024) TaxID=203122 RepID=Q21I80_SACD2|nr:hypothetical protein [Saccharophagus degradans]ABD81599.1 hypothetical protein Sde_2339 [Saccharophagus degradans 2-40]
MPVEDKWYSIKVEAIVSLLPASESGRVNGITSGYRPNHNFGGPENVEMRMGQITVQNNEWITPGESKPVKIHFIMPDGYVVDLFPGLIWRIQEGGNLVGSGKITKLISSDVPVN